MPRGVLEVPNPLIVVEVLSPSTQSFDLGGKLQGYFALPSLRHYIILDPPGLDLDLAEMLAG